MTGTSKPDLDKLRPGGGTVIQAQSAEGAGGVTIDTNCGGLKTIRFHYALGDC